MKLIPYLLAGLVGFSIGIAICQISLNNLRKIVASAPLPIVLAPAKPDVPVSLQTRMLDRWMEDTRGEGGNFDRVFGEDERRKIVAKNQIPNLESWLAISSDIDRVRVGTTSDTETPVIYVTDGSGKEAILWIKKDGRVLSISGESAYVTREQKKLN